MKSTNTARIQEIAGLRAKVAEQQNALNAARSVNGQLTQELCTTRRANEALNYDHVKLREAVNAKVGQSVACALEENFVRRDVAEKRVTELLTQVTEQQTALIVATKVRDDALATLGHYGASAEDIEDIKAQS